MGKELVVKHNALINATYSLNLVEQRLILLAIVVLREDVHNVALDCLLGKPIKITADSYMNAFGVGQSTAYETLKDACKTLFSRQFSYQEPRDKGRIANKTTRWVSDIAYIDNSATIEFTFAPAVLPFVTELEKYLTSYEIRQVANLTSGYAVRLYELLIAWRSAGKTPQIKLDEFRDRMGILKHEYQKMGQFKEKVLHIALEQINKHTDIKATYEQHKEGRSIVAFSFKFKQKEKKTKVIEMLPSRDPKTVDWVNGVSDDEIRGMTPSQAIKYAQKLHRVHDIVGNWSDCNDYEQTKSKLIKQLQQPLYIREYMPFLLACDEPFDPKTVGFK